MLKCVQNNNQFKMIDQIKHILDIVTFMFLALFFFLVGYRPPWWEKKYSGYKIPTNTIHDIPGPLSLPILGTRWVYTFGGYSFSKIHVFYKDMFDKYGPIIKEEALFNVPVVSVCEKRDIEAVLKCTSKYPFRPPTEAIAQYRRSRPDRYASTGIVNEQGEVWHHLRTTLTTDLMSPKTISSFLPQVQDIADDWCNLLKQLKNSKGDVMNLERAAGRLGLEATCALVLGRRMGFLLPGGESEIARKLSKAVHNHFIASRDTYYGLPFWKIINTPSYKKLIESEGEIYTLALELIKTADDSTKESAVFQSVLKANVDNREKTAAIIDFIAAGIHTLKNSFLFLLHLVAENPDVQENIINDCTNNNYVKACVNESFRFLPTASCIARITEEELVLSGYKLEAGSVILCHNGIACRDERNFKQANKFRPERWLNDEKLLTASNATYLVAPFGVGRRICPGKRFIEQILPVLLEATVNSFQFKVEKPLELTFEFLLAPKAPITMNFQERY